ncbi:MAG TPA: transaldolase [Gemmatimonadales bacterium]|nr:transaldolase [Gemmatimonadales bacterium]
MSNPLVRLGELGQSPWYDYITRDLVTGGALARLIAEDGLRGMTSNPTIFEKAVSGSHLYDDDLRRLADEGKGPAEIFDAFADEDIRAACDLFAPLYEREGNGDGTVSVEVAPTLADDGDATLAEAQRIWKLVGRPNVLVKIPGTKAGLPAIERATAAGVSVNITLLFSVERYREVIEAYLRGLEQRVERGESLAGINSVASFFVSRVDTKIDPLLDRMGDPHGIRGRAAIANACKAYELFEETMAGARWRKLAAAGARLQRPLWASTSTKDPKYPDTYYVEALVAPYTVNTLPPDTFDAYRDHGNPVVRIREGMERADRDLAALADSGIDLAQMTRELEEEGVKKFAASYEQLLAGIEAKAGALVARG